MIFNCPGSERFKQPAPENIRCGNCGREAEIWTDEFRTKCPNCLKDVTRPSSVQSCLDWCQKARECVGEAVYEEYLKNKKDGKILKEGE